MDVDLLAIDIDDEPEAPPPTRKRGSHTGFAQKPKNGHAGTVRHGSLKKFFGTARHGLEKLLAWHGTALPCRPCRTVPCRATW